MVMLCIAGHMPSIRQGKDLGMERAGHRHAPFQAARAGLEAALRRQARALTGDRVEQPLGPLLLVGQVAAAEAGRDRRPG
ncbi:hypothetical protein ALISP_2775 [Alicycliphilus sp. B1]|nr:hypothetical protein ALISP_2775 [Alicycliphilus sp. B1]